MSSHEAAGEGEAIELSSVPLDISSPAPLTVPAGPESEQSHESGVPESPDHPEASQQPSAPAPGQPHGHQPVRSSSSSSPTSEPSKAEEPHLKIAHPISLAVPTAIEPATCRAPILCQAFEVVDDASTSARYGTDTATEDELGNISVHGMGVGVLDSPLSVARKDIHDQNIDFSTRGSSAYRTGSGVTEYTDSESYFGRKTSSGPQSPGPLKSSMPVDLVIPLEEEPIQDGVAPPRYPKLLTLKICVAWLMMMGLLEVLSEVVFVARFTSVPSVGCWTMAMAGNYSEGEERGAKTRNFTDSLPVLKEDWDKCYSPKVFDAGRLVRFRSGAEWVYMHCFSCECEMCLSDTPQRYEMEMVFGTIFAFMHKPCHGTNLRGESMETCSSYRSYGLSIIANTLSLVIFCVDVGVAWSARLIEGRSQFYYFKVLGALFSLSFAATIWTATISNRPLLFLPERLLLWGALCLNLSHFFEHGAVCVAKHVHSWPESTRLASRRFLFAVPSKLLDLKEYVDNRLLPFLSCRSASMVLMNIVLSRLMSAISQADSILAWHMMDNDTTRFAMAAIWAFGRHLISVGIPYSECRRQGCPKRWSIIGTISITLIIIPSSKMLSRHFKGEGVRLRAVQNPDLLLSVSEPSFSPLSKIAGESKKPLTAVD